MLQDPMSTSANPNQFPSLSLCVSCHAACTAFSTVLNDFFLPTRHFTRNCQPVKHVGIVAKDLLASARLSELVISYSRHSHFVVPCEHDAWSANNSSFQHLVHFSSRTVKLSALLYQPSEQIMQAHSRGADCILEYVDPLPSVKSSYLFQGFQTR